VQKKEKGKNMIENSPVRQERFNETFSVRGHFNIIRKS